MTHAELIAKTESMLPAVNEGLRRTIARLVRSGAIDVDSATNYTEAKAVLCAALRQEVEHWRLHGEESEDERNLMGF